MSCRACIHYDVRPDADGKVRMRRASVARCSAPIPDLTPLLPHSITTAHDWHQPKVGRWMQPDDGAGCPLFSKKPK